MRSAVNVGLGVLPIVELEEEEEGVDVVVRKVVPVLVTCAGFTDTKVAGLADAVDAIDGDDILMTMAVELGEVEEVDMT